MPEQRKASTQRTSVVRKQSRVQQTKLDAPTISDINSDNASDFKSRRISKAPSNRSGSPTGIPKKNITLENTYRLEPDEESQFHGQAVRSVAEEVLDAWITKDTKYDPTEVTKITRTIADKVKEKVKNLRMIRHKFVTHVLIGEVADARVPSVQVASRCLWNHNLDNFVSVRKENSSLFVIVTVYGVYFE